MRLFRSGLLALFGLLGSGVVRAQDPRAPSATPAPTAPLSTYVQVVQGDSIRLFYSPDYQMVQPACARLRRQTRLDANGSFTGTFRDATWPSDSVLLTGRYVHGTKEGQFTWYHANGKWSAQGQYRANKRVGEWKFWRATGQLELVLDFDGGTLALPAVRQYWAVEGQQLVVDGTGIWHREIGVGNDFSGPVVGGRPVGIWQLSPAKPGLLAKWSITETYGPDGEVKAGVEKTTAGFSDRYHGATRVPMQFGQPFEEAERFRLRPPCEAPVRMAKSTFGPAFYRLGLPAYYELLWRRIHPVDLSGTVPRNALGNYQGVLRFVAQLNANGSWEREPSQVEGTSLEAARQLLALMRALPKWEPAHKLGEAVNSLAMVEYSMQDERMQLHIQPLLREPAGPETLK